MAYKFQIGAAILSGSIKAEDGLVSTDVDDATAANIVAQIDDKEIAHTKVALENGDILIGDGSGIAQNQTISGDATLAAGGALTIADNAISLAKMAGLTRGSIIHGDSSGDPAALAIGSANTILSSDGSDLSYTAVSNDMLANSAVTITAGDGLKTGGSVALGSSVTLDVDVSDFAGTGIDADGSEKLNIAAAQTTITSIINSSMGKIGTDAAQEYIDFSTANEIKFAVNNAVVASAEAGVFVVAGDLRVQGTTTTVDSTTINVSSSFTFEGVADDYETTLNIVDPAADRTVSLPDASGVLAIFDPSLSDSELATALTAAPSEINLLDGGASVGSSITLADADGIIVNDGGVTKLIPASDIKSYVSDAAQDVTEKADGDTLSVGVNYFADMSSDGEDAVALPASPSVGQSVKVKAPSDCSEARYITINRAGSQTIDGAVSIRLESPFAAVELVYVASDDWRVF